MKKSIQPIILSFLVFSLSACSYYFDSEQSAGANSQSYSDGEILSFAALNDLVLAPNCLGCHSGKDEPLLTNYSQVLAHKDKIYEQVIITKKMPPQGGKLLSARSLSALKIWLEAGAPEFSKDKPNTPPPTDAGLGFERPVLWAQVRDKVINRNCTSCHYTGNSDGISAYEDYETVKATIGTIFYTISIQPVMPPPPPNWPEDQPNPNQLTRAQKDLISAWVNDGMKLE